MACPGVDVGLLTASFKLNFAEAYPDIDVRESVKACPGAGERRAEMLPGDDIAGVDNLLSASLSRGVSRH